MLAQLGAPFEDEPGPAALRKKEGLGAPSDFASAGLRKDRKWQGAASQLDLVERRPSLQSSPSVESSQLPLNAFEPSVDRPWP